jgi:hypothetical protein
MEQLRAVCRNAWCKSTFFFNESEMTIIDGGKKSETEQITMIEPPYCPKCRSFNNDLSGGVEWKDREYEGSRIDSTPHQIKYKVTNFKL